MKFLIFSILIVAAGILLATPVLEEKFLSTDQIKKQWTMTQTGKFMSCENGTLKIVNEGTPVYRCISWLNKPFNFINFHFKVEITILNNNEEWAGVNIDGINFLIRRGGFNYSYHIDGEKSSVNKVVAAKIENGKPYSIEIIRFVEGGKSSVRWIVNGKEITIFEYTGKLTGAGTLRLGSFGMGASFSKLTITDSLSNAPVTAMEQKRDMTMENVQISSLVNAKEAQSTQKNLKAVLEQKKKLGFKKFPIGAYTDCLRLSTENIRQMFYVEDEFRDWKDIGFSLMFSPAFNSSNPEQKEAMAKLLSLAAKYDLKILLTDYNFYNKSHQDIPIEKFRNDIKTMGEYFSNFEAFAGFMIADEPTEKNIKRSLDFARAHKEVLPGKLPFINFGFEPSTVGKDSWDDFFSSVIKDGQLEVLSYDFYGHMLDKEKLSSYYFMILENLRASSLKNGVPFWIVGLVTPHLYFIEPDFNDLRWQFNTALVYGASGYFWWFYYDERHGINANYRNSPVDWNGDKTPSYYHLKRFQQKFRNQYGDLFNNLVSTRITHYPEKIVVGEKWTPNELLEGIEIDVRGTKNSIHHQVLIGEFTDAQDRKYIMFVNNNRTTNVSLRLKFPKNVVLYHYDAAAEKLGMAREYGIGKHWLAPGQEVLYRVESKK